MGEATRFPTMSRVKVVGAGFCFVLAVLVLFVYHANHARQLGQVHIKQQRELGLQLQRQAWQGLKLHLHGLTLSVANATQHYAIEDAEFCNKCDFELYKQLLPILPCCSDPSAVVLTAGVNRGALVDIILQHCRAPTVHGFEIQEALFEDLQLKYSKAYNHRVVFSNKGLSDGSHTLAMSSGLGLDDGKTGLYASFRGSNGFKNNTPIETISLAQYVRHQLLHDRVCMAIIDVEGHEAKVIQGMALMENRLSFPIFAYELGGTWVDTRNPSTWSQSSTAEYLINLGYHLFLIGRNHLLPVDARFFADARVHDEGYGHFVQGNLLAVHESIIVQQSSRV